MRVLINERWCGEREREGRERKGERKLSIFPVWLAKMCLCCFWFCSFTVWPNLFQEVVYS